MIGIRKVGVCIPPGRVSNHDRCEEFGIDPSFLTEKIGVDSVSRLAPGEDTLSLCEGAVADLVRDEDDGLLATVQAVVVCTQNPQGGGLPHTSALLHAALGLHPSATCFDISLGCSGFVQSLSILSSYMEAQGLDRALLVTADPYSKIVNMKDRDTALLFGDGATATMLERSEKGSGLFELVAFRSHTEGNRAKALAVVDGVLVMDGRAVFNFAAVAAPREIKALLSDADITVQDIDAFLLHQGSAYIVNTIAKRLGVSPDAVPFKLREHGNTVSSTIPSLLSDIIDDKSKSTIVVCGFGVGLSVATGLLKRMA